jgi:TetR/AcrR family transcriptional regulator, acrAB operon repressor
MVRKTKENAELTRLKIIEAARQSFLTRGVSRTSMEQIAAEAGVTRGAIYWHFANKKEIFTAMREQVFLPLIDRMDENLQLENIDDPLEQLIQFLNGTIATLNESLETRQTYEILMIKCEYVDDLVEVLDQMLDNCARITEKIEQLYTRAKEKGQLRTNQSPAELAMDTHLFFIGLLHMWVKDTGGCRFRTQATELVKTHINLHR